MALPIQDRPVPQVDTTCRRIAEYLRDGLNSAYITDYTLGLQQQIINGISKGYDVTDLQYHLTQLTSGALAPKAVIGIRDYDAFNVPNMEFPLLKIYRTQDFYKQTTVRTSPIVAAYCLILPSQEDLQSSLAWVSKTMSKLLLDSLPRFCTFTDNREIRVEYRTLLSEIGIPAYAFVRAYFTIKD